MRGASGGNHVAPQSGIGVAGPVAQGSGQNHPAGRGAYEDKHDGGNSLYHAPKHNTEYFVLQSMIWRDVSRPAPASSSGLGLVAIFAWVRR